MAIHIFLSTFMSKKSAFEVCESFHLFRHHMYPIANMFAIAGGMTTVSIIKIPGFVSFALELQGNRHYCVLFSGTSTEAPLFAYMILDGRLSCSSVWSRLASDASG